MQRPSLPQSHLRSLNIVGIDVQGDVWCFASDDPFRADSVLQQMKQLDTGVVFIEQPQNKAPSRKDSSWEKVHQQRGVSSKVAKYPCTSG